MRAIVSFFFLSFDIKALARSLKMAYLYYEPNVRVFFCCAGCMSGPAKTCWKGQKKEGLKEKNETSDKDCD
jgi:hypothetical protein